MPVIVTYNELNRLIHATGKAKNASYDMAMTFGLMSEPLTKIQKVDSSLTAKFYNFAYKYEDESHPTAPTQIGHDHYEANLKKAKIHASSMSRKVYTRRFVNSIGTNAGSKAGSITYKYMRR